MFGRSEVGSEFRRFREIARVRVEVGERGAKATDLLWGGSCVGEAVLEPDDVDGVIIRAARIVSIGIRHILLFSFKK
jgi:hypothetical protein